MRKRKPPELVVAVYLVFRSSAIEMDRALISLSLLALTTRLFNPPPAEWENEESPFASPNCCADLIPRGVSRDRSCSSLRSRERKDKRCIFGVISNEFSLGDYTGSPGVASERLVVSSPIARCHATRSIPPVLAPREILRTLDVLHNNTVHVALRNSRGRWSVSLRAQTRRDGSRCAARYVYVRPPRARYLDAFDAH